MQKNIFRFLKKLYIDLKKGNNRRHVIILDNLKLHKIKEIILYCAQKKINLFFNIPYQSIFNGKELCFRAMKILIYSNIFNSFKELKDKLNNLIEEETFKKTLLYNFKETLNEYLYYSQGHK